MFTCYIMRYCILHNSTYVINMSVFKQVTKLDYAIASYTISININVIIYYYEHT